MKDKRLNQIIFNELSCHCMTIEKEIQQEKDSSRLSMLLDRKKDIKEAIVYISNILIKENKNESYKN